MASINALIPPPLSLRLRAFPPSPPVTTLLQSPRRGSGLTGTHRPPHQRQNPYLDGRSTYPRREYLLVHISQHGQNGNPSPSPATSQLRASASARWAPKSATFQAGVWSTDLLRRRCFETEIARETIKTRKCIPHSEAPKQPGRVPLGFLSSGISRWVIRLRRGRPRVRAERNSMGILLLP